MLINRILLIGDDVDIYDWDKVMWAFATRCRPGQDEYHFDDVASHPLAPYMPPHPRRGGKLVSDCLLSAEYESPRNFREVNFQNSYPEGIKTRVLQNWTSMGFSDD